MLGVAGLCGDMYRVGGSVGRVNGDNCQFGIHAVVIAEFSHLSKAASPC